MAAYKPIPKQKPSTSAARKGPRIMSAAQKARNIRQVKFAPQANIPQPDQVAVGISIRKILRSTSHDVIAFAREIVIEKVQRLKTPKGLPAVRVQCWHRDPLRPAAQKRLHEVTVFGREDQSKPISRQNQVFCSCDCEDWVYRWEYAVARQGGTKIMYGNGEPPLMTNPTYSPGCCKHIAAVFEMIGNRGL